METVYFPLSFSCTQTERSPREALTRPMGCDRHPALGSSRFLWDMFLEVGDMGLTVPSSRSHLHVLLASCANKHIDFVQISCRPPAQTIASDGQPSFLSSRLPSQRSQRRLRNPSMSLCQSSRRSSFSVSNWRPSSANSATSTARHRVGLAQRFPMASRSRDRSWTTTSSRRRKTWPKFGAK